MTGVQTCALPIFDLLVSLNRQQGKTLLLVTHDELVARLASRRIQLRDGRVVGES